MTPPTCPTLFVQMETWRKANVFCNFFCLKITKYCKLQRVSFLSFAFCVLTLFTSLLTGSSVNQDALVGSQVAEIKQHHVGGDVVDGQGGRLLEGHALWDEEGVARRHHHHLLPQPEAAQHHHLVADLPGREERCRVNRGGKQ